MKKDLTEKLYEELLTDKENLKPSHNELIFIAEKESFSSKQQEEIIELINMAKEGNSMPQSCRSYSSFLNHHIKRPAICHPGQTA